MGSMYKSSQSGNYIDFLTPGVISQAILFMAIFTGVELIWDRQFGFLKETLTAPVSRLEIVLGRVLGGATNFQSFKD
jgi:ABC-2 type transport system permease protein